MFQKTGDAKPLGPVKDLSEDKKEKKDEEDK